MLCGPCLRSWAQPNDCGVNASFGWTLGKVVSEESCGVEASKGGAVFNRLFRKAYLRFRKEQAERLARDRRNAITSAWETSGLRGPLNPYCKGWTHAIQSFGEGSMLGLVLRSEGAAGAGGAEAGAEAGAAGAHEAAACAAAAQAQLRRVAGDRLVTGLLGLLSRGGSLNLRGVCASGSGASASVRGQSVQISPCDEAQPVLMLRCAELQEPTNPSVLQLRERYECADEQASAEARPEKRARTKERLEKEHQERLAAQAKARREYEAELLRLSNEAFAAASQGREAHDEVMGRLRAHYEKPPWRVIGKHLVCDAVQLTQPALLLNLLVQRVSERVADVAENGAQRSQPKGKGERRDTDGARQHTRDGGCCEKIARRVSGKRARKKAEKATVQVRKAARKEERRAKKEETSRQQAAAKVAAKAATEERAREAEAKLFEKHQPRMVLERLLALLKKKGAESEGLGGLPFVQQQSLLCHVGGRHVAKPTGATVLAAEREWRVLVAARLGDRVEAGGEPPAVGIEAVRRLLEVPPPHPPSPSHLHPHPPTSTPSTSTI